jgi:hypothetical protein
VFDASGASLNVALASSGLADDRYLNHFGSENADLAERLKRAFAEAGSPDCRA